ncbi:MAG: hypothetical protein JW790_03550 [Dehalococcoidales bacterium]|jgi:hypothetical protein|nr:hypothetical protein [Dehalococcoidales bacterium]
MSQETLPRCDEAIVKCLEGRRRRRQKLASPEPEPATAPPSVCTKPGCGGTVFIPHEDGWQCFNCMKIIYRRQHSPVFDRDNR